MNLEVIVVLCPLALPLLVLLAPRRRLWVIAGAVLLLQGLAAWLGGCLTHTWQCTDTCAWLKGACDVAGDGHDAAPFGIALVTLAASLLLGILVIVRLLFHAWTTRRRSARAT